MSQRLPILLLPLLLAAAGGCEPSLPSLSQDEATQLMLDGKSPDARREAVACLVTEYPQATHQPYVNYYHRLATSDPDFIVRATAIRALNVCRDATATPIFVAGLADEAEPVRLESAKALVHLPDPAAVPLLIRLADGRRRTVVEGRPAELGETLDVRLAAVDALRQYPTIDVEHALVNHLGDPDFSVAWQARQSLVTLTGQDLAYDQAAWLKYLVKA